MDKKDKQPDKNVVGPSDKELVDYLEGRLSEQEKRALEEFITDDDFSGDALEGLNALKNRQDAAIIHARLQRKITKNLMRKKIKQLLPLNYPMWIVLLTTVLMLVALAGYVLVKFLGK